VKCLSLEENIGKLDLYAPDSSLDLSEAKMSKKEKKQRQRMSIFEKQASMLDELSEMHPPET
jgi:predicted nucleic acid-binding protein